ncbi:SsrA-binding protein SmpB [Candidatus Parcubacteria bacterium]|nr:SsrA-binding protein SmpB [Candidatus Parcubacteria bacterium]
MALAENRKARFDFDLLKKFVAGIELSGAEVKSAREGKMSLRGAFIGVRGREAWLMGAEVPPYQPKNAPSDYDATRARKLLLTAPEVAELADAEATKGLTIVPLSVYNKGRFLKVEIAIAKGRKQYDKRQAIKKRDTERDLGRSL